MRRALLVFAFTLLVASRAHAAWWPVFSPTTYVQLRPGESITLNVQASWLSGISLVPFLPMTFAAEDASVASVDGYLPATSPEVPVRITAVRPGVTRLRIVESGLAFSTLPLIVVAEDELPLAIEVSGVLAPGRPVTLKAVSDEPDATFTWYWGSLGGMHTYFWKVGEGREVVVTENLPLQYSYWVLMTSPRGAGAKSVSIQLSEPASKRRAARH